MIPSLGPIVIGIFVYVQEVCGKVGEATLLVECAYNHGDKSDCTCHDQGLESKF